MERPHLLRYSRESMCVALFKVGNVCPPLFSDQANQLVIDRASSYQMAGNFLAACNEHEAAAKLIAEGAVLPPEPALSLSMDTNHGIRCPSRRLRCCIQQSTADRVTINSCVRACTYSTYYYYYVVVSRQCPFVQNVFCDSGTHIQYRPFGGKSVRVSMGSHDTTTQLRCCVLLLL